MHIGIDIGGTSIEAVAVDDDLSIVHRTRNATTKGNTNVVDGVKITVKELLQALRGDEVHVHRIGIGIPGVIDRVDGRVRHAVNLGVEDLALGQIMATEFDVDVVIDNDVNAAAFGATHLLGLGQSTAYLNLGTGMAAGIVVNGTIWHGARGGAGEVGHVPLKADGPLCACGQRGCHETYASGSALTRLWPTTQPYPALDLFKCADAGDERALVVKTNFVEAVASAVRMLILTADVESVVIGGGLSNLGDRLRQPLLEVFQRWSTQSAFIQSLALDSRTMLLPSGLPAAAVGAALLTREPNMCVLGTTSDDAERSYRSQLGTAESRTASAGA